MRSAAASTSEPGQLRTPVSVGLPAATNGEIGFGAEQAKRTRAAEIRSLLSGWAITWEEAMENGVQIWHLPSEPTRRINSARWTARFWDEFCWRNCGRSKQGRGRNMGCHQLRAIGKVCPSAENVLKYRIAKKNLGVPTILLDAYCLDDDYFTKLKLSRRKISYPACTVASANSISTS
jgi:hypothetical protein